jgi:hypothetical protein
VAEEHHCSASEPGDRLFGSVLSADRWPRSLVCNLLPVQELGKHQPVTMFRDETLPASTLLVLDPTVIVTPEQQAQASSANETGEPIILEGEHGIERRDDGWVVINNHGDFLVEVEKSCWSEDEGDPDLPSLRFSTPEKHWLHGPGRRAGLLPGQRGTRQ